MTRNSLPRLPLALSLAALLGAPASADVPPFDAQGLYSTQALLGAEVHFEVTPDGPSGEVVDLLFGDDLRVHALVVDVGDGLERSGERLVVSNTHYRLVHAERDDEVVHTVIVEADAATLDDLPRYDQAWWETARERARDAWYEAGDGAESAWQRTRRGADRVGERSAETWERTQEGADRVGERAESAWERTQEGAERAGRRISEALEGWNRRD
ncbi:hypothetical protein HOP51_08995 [Halomonas sp. MCCC 1A11036]|uniref:PRC-barrel domain-containing protein n=1 Tax=Billgrantia zhangzhouensis TaxID=2733481 RepID=A0ABS9AEW1_9GAMM|nr:hypothetical protein [Halomonas zhangzhouensis]MCE8020245.1 hypothetical protein [Halomonas zhangzhouensis]